MAKRKVSNFFKSNSKLLMVALFSAGSATLGAGTAVIAISGKELLGAGLILLGIACAFSRDYLKRYSDDYVDLEEKKS